MHAVDTIQPIAATQSGALDGHEAVCTCGHVVRTSLSPEMAALDLQAHIRWAKEVRR